MTIDDLYKRARDKAYQNDRTLDFTKDAEKAFQMESFPEKVKAKIHYLAYEGGHAGGYSDMVTQYFDLVDLAKLCLGI